MQDEKKNQSVEFIKQCIADALILLMKVEPFDEINVKEICAKSGIGRTTYYRHFDNKLGKKNILLFKIYNDWENYSNDKEKQLEPDNAFLSFVYEKRSFFKLIYENRLYDVLIELFLMIFGPEEDADTKGAYIKSYGAAGYFGILLEWIKNDFHETPKEIQQNFIFFFKNLFEEAQRVKDLKN